MSAEVPAGFGPSERTGPFFDMIGPVYTKTGERGQSGAVSDLYRAHDLDAGSIVNAALAALSLR